MKHLEKFELFLNSDNQRVNESPFFKRIIGEFVERGIKWLGKNLSKVKPTVKTTKSGITMENGKPEDVRAVYGEAQKTGSYGLGKLASLFSTKSIKYFSDANQFISSKTIQKIPSSSVSAQEEIIINKLNQKLANIIPNDTPFRFNIRVIEKSIIYPGTPYERELTLLELPNGKTCIFYKSSGSNVGSTGKRKGEWFILPGFASDGWFIKTFESISITNPRIAQEKGFQNNKYLTELAKWLESNGAEELNFLYWLNYGK